MNCEDLQLDDIVLLQLFKDQIINSGLDQAKGGDMNYIYILIIAFVFSPLSASTERISGHQTDFSDLEKALSDPKPSLPPSESKAQWPDCHPMARLAGFAGHSAQGRGWSSRTSHHFLVSEASSYGPPDNLKTESNLPRDLPTTRRDRTGRDI